MKAQLKYDPLGRLYETTNYVGGVSQGAVQFIYDGDALVAEYNAAGAMLARHIHGPNAKSDDPLISYTGAGVSPADRRHLYADARGSKRRAGGWPTADWTMKTTAARLPAS